MQQVPLLTTKLYIPPIRSELVSRPRLIERVNAGLNNKLTLVSAPAGFGKTTLVCEWVQAMSIAAAPAAIGWLSLDEGDNDPTRFLTYFVAALNHTEPTIGEKELGLLQSPQPPPIEVILISLINEISIISNRIILILDDYHMIEASPIHDALTFLFEHLPAQLHLVITTREDPPIPLSRLRARGQLTELRAADLRFSSEETTEFLDQVMGLDLSSEDIVALENRTEGWIAGLQLAAISMQGRTDVSGFIQSFAGSHHFILDYLIEEVLDRQSDNVQIFLLQTAILDQLTGDLCDAVRFGTSETPGSPCGTDDQRNGQAILEMLERTNLFIVPLDSERRWYRYHHLFANLLRQRLHQTQAKQIPTLRIRASVWYEQHGFIDEAIEYAMRAEHFERAAQLIDSAAEVTWARGEDIKLRRWLDALPLESICTKTQLCIFHAWSLFITGQMEAADRVLKTVERILTPGVTPPNQMHLSESESKKLRGRAATVQAFMSSFQGDLSGIVQHAQLALEYLPQEDLSWRSTAANTLGDAYDFNGEMVAAYQARLDALEASKAAGNIYQVMIANLKLAILHRQRGHLQQVVEICQQQWQLANESGMAQTAVVGWLLAIWGEVLAEFNDVDQALEKTRRGVELIERGGDVAILGWSYLCLARVLFTRGDLTEAEEIVQKMVTIIRENYVPPWITNLVTAWQARIWLAQNKLDAVVGWVRRRGLDSYDDHTYLREVEYIVVARVLLAQGRLDEAARLLQRLIKATEAGGRTSRNIEVLMLQAIAYQTTGDATGAFRVLERALTLAEPGGYVRIFVDEGPPMARLLYDAGTRGIAPDYARRLLAAFPMAEPEPSRPSIAQDAQSGLIEPLSQRELEVLQLIAEGLSNREIASKLYVSLNTVKGHTRHIYGKLGVNNRTQASVRARALGILPSI